MACDANLYNGLFLFLSSNYAGIGNVEDTLYLPIGPKKEYSWRDDNKERGLYILSIDITSL